MTSIAYCVLSPKPFYYCQTCARNPAHAEYSWKMKFKSPVVDGDCKDYMEIDSDKYKIKRDS